MYNVFLFMDSWILYDASNKVKKTLSPTQANLLKELFPLLFAENRVLSAIQISNVNPNKLHIGPESTGAPDKTKPISEQKT
jgi:hypothetical protein